MPVLFFLASCHPFAGRPEPVSQLAPFGQPLAEPADLEAMDDAAQSAMWKDSFGVLAMPARPLDALKKLYGHDLLSGRPVSASNTRWSGVVVNGLKISSNAASRANVPDAPPHAPGCVTDGDGQTFWATDDAVRESVLAIDLDAPKVVTHVVIEEVPALGARVRDFTVDALVDGKWQSVAQGSGIGARRVIRLDRGVTAQALRVHIAQNAAACPALRRVSAFCGPAIVRVLPESADFLDSTTVRMEASRPGAIIRYTLGGSDPSAENSMVYDPSNPPKVARTCLIQAVSFSAEGGSAEYGLPPATAQVVLWPESKMQPASVFALPLERGLNYACFEMNLAGLAALKDAEPAYAGVCDGFNLNVRKQDAGVALVYEGWIQVPRDGLYKFSLDADDGAQLWIGDAQVVDQDAPHEKTKKEGLAALRAGWHPLRAAWFNNAGGWKLEVKCFGPGCPSDGEIKGERFGR